MSTWLSEPPKEGTPEWWAEVQRKLSQWQTQKLVAERAKADEVKLRKEFVEFAFSKEKLEGTERLKLANGYEVKAVKELNYSFTSEEDLEKALITLADTGPYGAFIVQRLIKITYELVKGEYRKLTPEHKAIIDPVIETKESTPALEIIPPKGTLL